MAHYFEPSPGVTSSKATVAVVVPGASFTMHTDRGVALDLGCGTGAIAVTMALRSPGLEVWAVDVNERARALCAANAAAAGAVNVRVAAPDDVPAGLRVDVIWSNPPIRIGKDALHELLLAWLDRLVPDGTALLVVQKHLGADSLQRWLTESGWPTSRAASAKGYRLLQVHPSVEGHRSVEGGEIRPPTPG